jgi:DNA-binding transcriptional ArsR family regulator
MTYDVFHAVAEPMRRRILSELRRSPRSVNQLAAVLPVSQPAVSQHLKLLLEAGLVTVRPVGRRRVYAIRPKGVEPLRAWVEEFWDEKLQKFARSFEEEAEP